MTAAVKHWEATRAESFGEEVLPMSTSALALKAHPRMLRNMIPAKDSIEQHVARPGDMSGFIMEDE